MAVEKRLVDLNSVIEQLENEWGYEGIREDLYKLPTVDAVEVVRCKDCKFCEQGKTVFGNEYFECNCEEFLDECIGVPVYPDDFCSYGERREGE